MSDNIIVAVRCRPFNQREKDLGSRCVVAMEGSTTYLDAGSEGRKTFNYDHSYWSHSESDAHFATQETLYNDIGKGVLTNCWEGYNATLFAYGQTGSGKSFSMLGVDNGKTLPGIIPRVCKEIFETLRDNPPPDTKVVVTVSMLEIYNEKLRDLLDAGGGPPGGLKMKQNKTVGFYVEGLSRTVVDSEDHVMSLMNLGATSRTIRATDMNAQSSRAHTLFVINVEQNRTVKTGGKVGVVKKTSALNLVDLAGSERAQKTGATGDALKEGSNINLSLLYLGQVISMLSNPKAGQVVPFRQSKLTSLLKESLGGNSKTAMIAAISPAEDNFDETLSTLQFATRAKSCKTSAKVNLDEGSKLLNDLRLENEKLKMEMEKLASGRGGAPMAQRFKHAFQANAKAIRQMFEAIDQDHSGEARPHLYLALRIPLVRGRGRVQRWRSHASLLVCRQVSYEEFTAFLTEGKTAKKLGEFSEILSILMCASRRLQRSRPAAFSRAWAAG
jgi:kinesin family protein 1/kinesin family protein 13